MRWFVLFLMLLASPLGVAQTVTTKYTVTNAGWTDLGAGPMQLSFRGQGVYAIADTTPSLVAEGFQLAAGDSVALNTTSHVWAMAPSALGVDVYAAPITPASSGGGGGGTITAGTTPTSGFTAGQLLMSNGSLVQPAGAASATSLLVQNGAFNAPAIKFPAGWGVYFNGTEIGLTTGAGTLDYFGLNYISLGNHSSFLYAGDIASNLIGQHNTTNAQASRVYNTFTDVNNSEWAALDWQTTPNVLTIGTQMNGTGTARSIQFVYGGSDVLDYNKSIAGYWLLNASGLVPLNPANLGSTVKPWLGIYGNAYFVGGTAGVSCAAGTVTLATMVVTNGIVTHC